MRSTRRRLVVAHRQIERVLVVARRVVRRNVQGTEIAPVGFDIRPVGDGKPHGAENRRHFLHGAADRMDQSLRSRARRQGEIQPLGGEPGLQRGLLQCDAARLDRAGQGVLQLVKRAAALAPLFGRRLAEVLQQRGQPAIAAEHGRRARRPTRADRRRRPGRRRFRPSGPAGRRSWRGYPPFGRGRDGRGAGESQPQHHRCSTAPPGASCSIRSNSSRSAVNTGSPSFAAVR